jgi:hypothetical protein
MDRPRQSSALPCRSQRLPEEKQIPSLRRGHGSTFVFLLTAQEGSLV